MKTVQRRRVYTYYRDTGFCRECGVKGRVWVDVGCEPLHYCLDCGYATDCLQDGHASQMVDALTDTVSITEEWTIEMSDLDYECHEKIADIGRRFARQMFGDGSQVFDLNATGLAAWLPEETK